MLSTVLGLFTGTQRWLYIALVFLGVLCVGLASLSVSLYGNTQALHVKVESAKEELKTLKKEHKEIIDVLEEKLSKIQKEKEELQDTVSKVEALSAQERADAKRNAELGAKKQQEIKRTYEERLKRFSEKVKEVKDYGESDSSIVDAAGI